MKKNELKFNGLSLAHLMSAGRTQLQKYTKLFAQEYPAYYGRRIEVKQLGLKTGVVVPVRVIKRVHIPVKFM